MAAASDSFVEGICIVDAAAGAMTASTMAGKGAGDREVRAVVISCGECDCDGSSDGDGCPGDGSGRCTLVVWRRQRRRWQQQRLGMKDNMRKVDISKQTVAEFSATRHYILRRR